MPAITSRTLSESERTTLVNALHVAAERFKQTVSALSIQPCPNCQDRPGKDGLGRICKTCKGSGDIPTQDQPNKRLAQQFERQITDTLALAERIEDAESIEVRQS